MLGAVMKAVGLIDPASINIPLAERFGKIADKNRRALERAYAETVIEE
jgi:pyruvate ferredoxin oxidoreductase gamma subunit